MGQNFYLKSPKEQMAPLGCQEESGIENWLYNQKAILLDANTWKRKGNTILSSLLKKLCIWLEEQIDFHDTWFGKTEKKKITDHH